jgi:glycosyltransferase involved in cell wall biosynthesis
VYEENAHREPLHLLYVIDSISSSGGAERSLAALAPAYRDLGIELDVAYLHERDGLHAELEAAGAALFSLAGPGGRPGWISRTRSLLRRRQPDLVHTTLFEADIAGRIAARWTGTPVVSSLVSASYGPSHYSNPALSTWKLRGAQLLDAATARLAVRLHAVSSPVAEAMSRRLRFPRERIDVVPRGRNAQQLGTRNASRRAAARSALNASEHHVVLVAVARHEFEKGLDLLIRALPLVRARCPETRLVVAGREGNQTDELHHLVAEHELSEFVSFLGPRHDVAEVLCAADAFVLASRREGFPGSVLEAMALDAPIVASNLPEVREIVDSDCAVLFEPGSVGALARAIEYVTLERFDADSRARRARERFTRQFRVEPIAAEMAVFYRRALDQSSRTTGGRAS